jgi:hypothetical protein
MIRSRADGRSVRRAEGGKDTFKAEAQKKHDGQIWGELEISSLT